MAACRRIAALPMHSGWGEHVGEPAKFAGKEAAGAFPVWRRRNG
jgi:hypothetical protein